MADERFVADERFTVCYYSAGVCIIQGQGHDSVVLESACCILLNSV